MTATALADWLTGHLAASLKVPPHALDRAERFSRYGLDSLGATRMIAELSSLLGRPLSPTLAWEYPTISALVNHVTGQEEPVGPPARPAGGQRSPHRGAADNEPIAIVGMACRLPGAPSISAFWRLLRDGVGAVSSPPAGRWDDRALADASIDRDEARRVRRGAFLDRIDDFDPLFFGISPREAASMDPQQRLMLELSWEALEDAGIRPSSLSGTNAAVLIGAIWSDYAMLMQRAGIDGIDRHSITGTHHSILANRISYVLGLHGPSFAIDSACSSGLVVAHLASQSLRAGESTLAIAGAVNLNILPESALGVARFGALSQDGACRAFDAKADGYVRGEGGGVLILKLLSQAIKDGDPIYCVLRGSAVNNDGASNGLTAPNPKAQEAVLRAAYNQAGVDAAAVQYVEAHGTGTPLGDPIEARALGAVLGAGRSPEAPLLIGSAKTNIGHLESAAGTVGLMKVALAMRHRLLPPSRNFDSPNPHIDLTELRLRVLTAPEPWPAPDRRLLAGVSSFGLGGTNGHVVVEEWPGPPSEVLLLSGESDGALLQNAAALRSALDGDLGREPLRDVCGGAAAHLGPGDRRAAIVARSHAGLRLALDRLLRGEPDPSVHTAGMARADASRGVVLVFPGQGAQWPGMAVSLFHREPVFRAVIERCDAAVQRYLGWSLIDELLAPRARSRLDDIEYSLPTIISIDVAVAAWWRSMGIEPAAVVGHSTGEIAAAHVAGALSLDDAMRVICAYGRLISRLSGRGGMALVGLPWGEAQEAIAGLEGRVFCAIQDSAEATVLAGEPDALDALVRAFSAKGVLCRPVAMNVSPHSPLVDSLRDELFEALRGIRPRRCAVPLISEVTGAEIDGASLDAAHWVKNFGDPALFSPAVDELIRRGHRVFIDVGPHPITKRSVETNLRKAGAHGVVLSSLRRDEDERGTLLDALSELSALGLPVRWREIYPEAAGAGSSAGDEPPFLLPLAAKSAGALTQLATSWSEMLRAGATSHLRDLVFTASARRDHHRYRAAVVGQSRAELADALGALAEDKLAAGAARGEAPLSGRPKVVFVLPGQGSQWVGMGQKLHAEEPVFRAAITACDEVIRRESGFSIEAELFADEAGSRLSEIDVVQPMLFAIGVALGALWRSWGVEPDAVVGHSMGEAAAAHIAGILSLEDAAKVICRRSRLLRRVSGQGSMALLGLTRGEAERALRGREARLSVAVSNGPRSTVVSGDPEALDELLAELERQGVFCARIKVDVASHSPQMDPLLRELSASLADVRPRPAKLPMRSTVTGEAALGPEMDARYWARNLREPVLFSAAVTALLGEAPTLFVELSPHPVLSAAIQENLSLTGRSGLALASMRRGEDERRALRQALADLYARGAELDWVRLSPRGGRAVALPAHPWIRERHWPAAPDRGPRLITAAIARGGHPLLGQALSPADRPNTRYWEQHIELGRAPYLADHRVQGAVVFPAAGYIEMALAAAAQAFDGGQFVLESVVLDQMMRLVEGAPRCVQSLVLREADKASISISSRDGGDQKWLKQAWATARESAEEGTAWRPPREVVERCARIIEPAEHYAKMAARRVDYGPAFRGLERIWLGEDEAVGLVRLPDAAGGSDGYRLHPALLDACLQTSALLLETSHPEETWVPVAVERLRVHGAIPTSEVWAHARRSRAPHEGGGVPVDLLIMDGEGRPLVEIQRLQLRRLGRPAEPDPFAGCVYNVAWVPSPLAPPSEPARAREGTWIAFIDEGGASRGVIGALRSAGYRCIEVARGAHYCALERDLYIINPASSEQFERLFQEILGVEQTALRGVLHLWSLDAAPADRATPETILADIRLGTLSALFVARALARFAFRDPPRVVLVTRGAQAAGSEASLTSVSQSPLWGFARVLSREHPELACVRIDLDPAASEGEAALLSREILSNDAEDQIALRGTARLVARLQRHDLAPAEPLALRADGAYIITGGLTGLGLSLGRWMVRQGARHLVLVGRRQPSAAANEVIAEMEQRGAVVRVRSVDVAQPHELARVLGEVRPGMPPVRGVVHSAAVLEDHPIAELTEETFWPPVLPKVLGAWNLRAQMRDEPLDFFVMYSSVAALLGSPGQANYAAASSFLDALAHQLRAEGLPATSLQWGPFSEVGLAAALESRGVRLSLGGLHAFTPDEGHQMFSRALQQPLAEVGLARMNMRQMFDSYPRLVLAPFLERMRHDDGAGADPRTTGPRLRPALASLPPSDRRAALEKHLLEQVEHVLRVPASRIAPLAPLVGYGMDSLMSLEIRHRLEASLTIRLPAAVFYTYPTIAALAEHLIAELRLDTAEPPAPPRAEPDPLKPRDELSKENEPIAIVGMACRFPGGASSPEAFLRLLLAGVDAITEVPRGRWAQTSTHGAGSRGARWGGFLTEDVSLFEPSFFGISPREAERLDPQQRLLLELTWEALERAGQVPPALVGSRTGVFIGLMATDYMRLSMDAAPEAWDAYTATGTAHCFPAARISYTFGFQGPALVIDTACSSSLVAVHAACQSLRAGESDMAIAGGINLILSPAMFEVMDKLNVFAPDARCKTFDARADGYVRGEGGGVIVLKRLSDARRDGDPIAAIIRGSAVNQDGRSTGLTAPNVLSQQSMLRQALANARATSDAIGYVEAHGTGTSLGDPIEVDALRAVLGAPREEGQACVLGAVKTNIGHLEAAAGVAGLIKAVMVLQEGWIPRNLHLRAMNPRISLDDTPFVLPTENRRWERGDRPRLAGVSSFGLSGTNAHVVLEEALADPRGERAARDLASYLLPLSASSPEALVEVAKAHAHMLAEREGDHLFDIAHTAALRRAHHEHRLAVVGRDRGELAAALSAFARDGFAPSVVRGTAAPAGRQKIVFVFPGQGSQWLGMGRQLLREEEVFRASMELLHEAIRRHGTFSLLEELQADPPGPRLGDIDVIQPMLFAIQVSLAALWRHWGVEPDAVVGHSMGEVAAACVAGILSAEDAAKVICRRSHMLLRIAGQGAMAQVELDAAAAAEAIAGSERALSVAAHNGLRSTVLSGDPSAMDAVLATLQARGVFVRRVKVDVASHSPQVDILTADLSATLSDLQPRAARIPMLSTVTGEPARGPELTAAYWVRNLRDPVLFSPVTRRLLDGGPALFVEISPHPVLTASIEEDMAEKKQLGAVIGSLRRQTDERRRMLEALGALHVHGASVRWSALYPGEARCVRLPTYPWQRRRYWIEERTAGDPRGAASARSAGAGETSPVGSPTSPEETQSHTGPRRGLLGEAVARAAPEQRLELVGAHLRAQLGRVLRMAPDAIDMEKALARYGLDSLAGMELRNGLQAELGVRLSMADLQASTPSVALAALIAERIPSSDRVDLVVAPTSASHAPGSWVVVPRPSPQARVRLFCFPYAGGAASSFFAWPGELPPEVEVCAIQPPGRQERSHEPLPGSVDEMVRALVPALLPHLDLPFATFGHSFGAMVMFEVVRALSEEHGKRPVHVFASGAPAPRRYLVPDLSALAADELKGVLRALGLVQASALDDRDMEQSSLPIARSDLAMAARYAPTAGAPIDAPLTAFAGLEDTFAPVGIMDDWRQETRSGFFKIALPGGHDFLVSERSALLKHVGQELLLRLAALEQQASAQRSVGPWLVRPAPRSHARARLLCVPGVGEESADYAAWAEALGDAIEVCVLEPPGRGARASELPLGRVDEIAAYAARAVLTLADRPFALFGHDLGALTAFEIVRELRRSGGPMPGRLFVSSAIAPDLHYFAPLHHLASGSLHAELTKITIDPRTPDSALRADLAAMSSYSFMKEALLDVPLTIIAAARDAFTPVGGVRAWSSQTQRESSFHVRPGAHRWTERDVPFLKGLIDRYIEQGGFA